MDYNYDINPHSINLCHGFVFYVKPFYMGQKQLKAFDVKSFSSKTVCIAPFSTTDHHANWHVFKPHRTTTKFYASLTNKRNIKPNFYHFAALRSLKMKFLFLFPFYDWYVYTCCKCFKHFIISCFYHFCYALPEDSFLLLKLTTKRKR